MRLCAGFLNRSVTRATATQVVGRSILTSGKALDLFTNETSRDEFRKLYDVVGDIITLPEFVQAEFSRGDSVKGRKFGKVRAVKTLKTTWTRPGTTYPTDHEMDLA